MKDISTQEVREHVKRTNPWWNGEIGAGVRRIKGLRPRLYLDLLYPLVSDTSINRAVVLLGPRRVGKTYLIFHLIERLISDGVNPKNIGYLDVEHPILHYQSLEAMVSFLEESAQPGETHYIFFDEIQYLRDWELHLKSMVDIRPDLRILVSGSAAAALKRQSQESGAGRFTDFMLPPLTFPEFITLLDKDGLLSVRNGSLYHVPDYAELNDAFVDYLNHGGYPELALSERAREDKEGSFSNCVGRRFHA